MEKIIVNKEALSNYKPGLIPNGYILVVKDKVTESGDLITDLFNSFGNLSINNTLPVTGVVVEIAKNINTEDIKKGDRILSVMNKVISIEDQENDVPMFLVAEDDVLALVDKDYELDFVNMKKFNVGTEDDKYGFNK